MKNTKKKFRVMPKENNNPINKITPSQSAREIMLLISRAGAQRKRREKERQEGRRHRKEGEDKERQEGRIDRKKMVRKEESGEGEGGERKERKREGRERRRKEGPEEEMVRENGQEEMKERREETWPAFIHPVP